MFFSLHPLTYLLPTVIPSHVLPLEQASLSSSCRAEFLSPVCLCPSACLSGFPHMGLHTPCWCWSLPCRCTCLTNTCSIVFLVSHCIPIAGCTLTCQPYMRQFPWDFMVKVTLSLCTHSSLPSQVCFSLYASMEGNMCALM